jgi:hypothetical protein
LCCKNWIAHIYRLQVSSLTSQKRLVGNGRYREHEGSGFTSLDLFSIAFFQTFPISGVM